ncbi:SEC-C metal-binding domain-containing protein [Bounagaea algeriensis]
MPGPRCKPWGEPVALPGTGAVAPDRPRRVRRAARAAAAAGHWCGSQRKYKKCCGAPGFADAEPEGPAAEEAPVRDGPRGRW